MNPNGDSKVSSVLLFVLSYPFASKTNKKLNAVGISSLPAAIKACRTTNADDIKKNVKRKMYACLISLFHSSAVFSGLFGRYPRLIQAHAIVGIAAAVKDSIVFRKEQEEQARLEAERRAIERGRGGSMSRWVKGWIFGPSSSTLTENDTKEDEKDGSSESQNDLSVPDQKATIKENKGLRKRFGFGKKEKVETISVTSPAPVTKTAKAQSAVKKTKSIIKGKRDSATDDIIWGVFQASFVLLDQTIGKALAYAWLLFLLTILEEALLNPKLKKNQRMKRLLWIMVTGYFSGRLVLPDWNTIVGRI